MFFSIFRSVTMSWIMALISSSDFLAQEHGHKHEAIAGTSWLSSPVVSFEWSSVPSVWVVELSGSGVSVFSWVVFFK